MINFVNLQAVFFAADRPAQHLFERFLEARRVRFYSVSLVMVTISVQKISKNLHSLNTLLYLYDNMGTVIAILDFTSLH